MSVTRLCLSARLAVFVRENNKRLCHFKTSREPEGVRGAGVGTEIGAGGGTGAGAGAGAEAGAEAVIAT